MSCVDAIRLIVRRADGEQLDRSERDALDAHLAGCPGCREALAGQHAVADVLRARPPERVSSHFHARLAERLDAESGWLGLLDWRTWTVRLAPAAAALALAAFLTADQPAAAPINLEAWAVSTTGESSPTSLLWDSAVSSELVLEELLGVEPASGGTDGR